jgi:hypothetical protein
MYSSSADASIDGCAPDSAIRSNRVICACLGEGRWAAGPRPVWLGHGTVPVVGTSAERRAARERVSAYHQSQLAELLTHVTAAIIFIT